MTRSHAFSPPNQMAASTFLTSIYYLLSALAAFFVFIARKKTTLKTSCSEVPDERQSSLKHTELFPRVLGSLILTG